MVKLANTLIYAPTDNPGVSYNGQHGIFRITLPDGSTDITRALKESRHRTFENHPDAQRYLDAVPANIWMTHANDVGCTSHVVKVKLTTDTPVYRAQYPLKQEQVQGIAQTIEGLLKAGVIRGTTSEYNTPLFPVKKSDLKNWRMVQDFRPLNEVTADESYPVPDPYIALNNLSPNDKYFTVIDLANAFFTIKLHPESQKYFAFTVKGRQYTYCRMPQGWKLSPGYFNHFLRLDLAEFNLPEKCTLIQYVDDLAISGPDARSVLQASTDLLTHLARKGYKVKREKIQMCRRSVYFLGREVSAVGQGVSDSNKDAILKTPKPKTVRQMLSFLGLCNYSREYVPNYTAMTAPLRELIKPHGMNQPTASLTWTTEAENSFTRTKQAVCNACALYVSDYTLPFHLDVAESQFYVYGILYQKKKGERRVLKHYSCKLDPHDQAQPGCARYLAALTKTIMKTAHLVQNHPLVVHTNHGIQAYLNSKLFITTAQRTANITQTLRQPHITYASGNINMAMHMIQ
ncbi:unnamed protein product [Knipowitschia caucasica]